MFLAVALQYVDVHFVRASAQFERKVVLYDKIF